MAQINFRIDDETKRRAEEFFNGAGLTMSGAIMIFIQQTLNRNELPFTIVGRPAQTLTKDELLRRIDDVDNGRNCHYHDLLDADEEEQPKTKSRRTSTRRRRAVA